jgi:uncharacterized phage protein (TIGR01671 family)
MRNIKFRGFGIVARKWFYGNLVLGNAGNYIAAADSDEDGDTITYYPIRTDTIGQFTGLVDCNGKGIYEGDIIHAKGGSIDMDFGVVTYHKNGYFYIDDSFGKFPRDCVKPIGDFFNSIRRNDDFSCVEFHISGNIHNDKSKNEN